MQSLAIPNIGEYLRQVTLPIKDRNGMDLREVEDIKKRWQEHTEELYKKNLHSPDNHNGEITHLEPSQVSLRKHHYEQS